MARSCLVPSAGIRVPSGRSTAVAPGGTVHMHEATPEAVLWDRPIDRLESAAAAAGREVTIQDTRRVKTHSEGVVHVVVDATVK